jgi:nitrite reductase (NO-forming)
MGTIGNAAEPIMWERSRAKLREWYIVVIAIALIGGGFFLASHQSSSTAPGAGVQTAGQTPVPEKAPLPHRQQTAAAPTVTSTAAPPSSSAPVEPAKAPQPAAQSSSQNEHPAAHKIAEAEPQTHTQAPGGGAAASPAGGAAASPAGGDAAAGRLVFRKCQACHSMEPGKNLLGPSLAGLIGRKAGTEANYNYSPAMKQTNIVWDAKTLDAYLADPQKVVAGNKMPFPGLKTEQDRADVIALLAGAGGAGTAAAALSNVPARAADAPPAGAAHADQAQINQAPQAAPSAGVTTCRTPATPCAPASPRAAWSISGSAARLMERSIRS